ARAEIDAVIGKNRLPDYSDQLSLPYIEAIIREIARWQPILPLGRIAIITSMLHCLWVWSME
ncbi:hypothetical protein BJ138DRAFT_1016068, partial [Hygrophoropsis aurantiaca]